jgi:hypothetical protein
VRGTEPRESAGGGTEPNGPFVFVKKTRNKAAKLRVVNNVSKS